MSLRALATVVVTTVMMLPHAWADTAWESYKSRFMMPDGRIIDTGNGNVSHTEGQGFAMLLAVAITIAPPLTSYGSGPIKRCATKITGCFTGAITRWRLIRWRIKTMPPMAIP
jgi:endoglucanase